MSTTPPQARRVVGGDEDDRMHTNTPKKSPSAHKKQSSADSIGEHLLCDGDAEQHNHHNHSHHHGYHHHHSADDDGEQQPTPDPFEWTKQFSFFLFDFDGTLVNTDRLMHASICTCLQYYSLDCPFPTYGEYKRVHNTPNSQWWNNVCMQAQALGKLRNPFEMLRKDILALYERARREQLALAPGVERLLTHLAEQKAVVAVVTHSTQAETTQARSLLPVLRTIPDHMWVTREQYQNPKPSPECYLLGLSVVKTEMSRRAQLGTLPMRLAALYNKHTQSTAANNNNHSSNASSSMLAGAGFEDTFEGISAIMRAAAEMKKSRSATFKPVFISPVPCAELVTRVAGHEHTCWLTTMAELSSRTITASFFPDKSATDASAIAVAAAAGCPSALGSAPLKLQQSDVSVADQQQQQEQRAAPAPVKDTKENPLPAKHMHKEATAGAGKGALGQVKNNVVV